METARKDLPMWMQESLRGTDWGVLIVLVFSLLAAWPFLLQPGLPRTNASEHYVYRSADFAQGFAEGRLYPRWSPNALSGFGAPIPSYLPPGAAYTPALLDLVLTNDATLAVRLIYAAAFCVAGAAVYVFVRRRSSAAAGVIAALLYVYSPYFGLAAPHILGDLPGVIGLALLPTLLWSVDRLRSVSRPPDVLYVALISAALLLTDVPSAIVAGALAAVLIVWSRSVRWPLALLGILLGAGMAACFWLPALAEADTIQWVSRSRAAPYTLTLGELFAPLRQVDPGALMPTPQFTLGLSIPVAVLASLLVVRRSGFHLLFTFLGFVIALLGVLVFPTQVGLLGVATLCLSIGGSAVVYALRWRPFLPLIVIVILTAAIPVWLAPRWSNAPIDTSPAAQVEYEQQGYGIAVLPDGDPLPTTLPAETPSNLLLLASYRSSVIDKIAGDSDVPIDVLEHDTHGDRFQVQTLAPLTLHVLTAYFPGWSARLNDTPVPLNRSADGLIVVELPGGTRGELAITLGSTPARTVAWMVTWTALLLAIAVTLRRSRRGASHYPPLDLLSNSDARLLAVLVLGFAAALALIGAPFAPLPLHAQPNYALAGSRTLDNRSDAGLEVLAYRPGSTSLHAGDTLDLTLYWQTLRPLTENYRVRVSLLDLATGQYRQPSALRQPGDYPTARWLPHLYVPDAYAIPLPGDFPGGHYSPAVEVFTCTPDCSSADRLTFFDGQGHAYGQVLVLPVVITVG